MCEDQNFVMCLGIWTKVTDAFTWQTCRQ